MSTGKIAELFDGWSTRSSVGSEFIEVRVRDRVAGVPLVGVGARELSAEVVVFREDRIVP